MPRLDVSSREGGSSTDRQRHPRTAEEALAEAQRIYKVYAPRIKAVTGTPVPDDVEFRIADVVDMRKRGAVALAAADPNVVMLSPAMFSFEDDQFTGTIVHELTHEALQKMHGDTSDPSKAFIEGLADYVRDVVMQDSADWGATVPKNKRKVKEGYQGAAGFFMWIEDKQPGTVKTVIKQLQAGSDQPLLAATGKNLDEWFQEFKAAKTPPTTMGELEREGLVEKPATPGTFYTIPADRYGDFLAFMKGIEPQHLSPHYAEEYQPGGWPAVRDAATEDDNPFGLITQAGQRLLGYEQDGPPTPAPIQIVVSGGGGGSSSSGPTENPVVAARKSMFRSIYISLWGEPPTEAYLNSAANSGMNSWEFALQERSKPAWANTKAARDATEAKVAVLQQMGI